MVVQVLPVVRAAIDVFYEPDTAARLGALADAGTAKAHRKLVDALRGPRGLRADRSRLLGGGADVAAELRAHGGPVRFAVLATDRDLDGELVDTDRLVGVLTDGDGFLAVSEDGTVGIAAGEGPNSVHLLR